MQTLLETLPTLTDEDLATLYTAIVAERERRTAAERPPDAVVVTIDTGHVDQAIIGYEPHRRGSNWIATVTHDPASPGGLARTFWAKGSGSYRAIPETVAEGDIIEVAHDYTSGGGNRSRNRDYYRLWAVTSAEVILVATTKP